MIGPFDLICLPGLNETERWRVTRRARWDDRARDESASEACYETLTLQ